MYSLMVGLAIALGSCVLVGTACRLFSGKPDFWIRDTPIKHGDPDSKSWTGR